MVASASMWLCVSIVRIFWADVIVPPRNGPSLRITGKRMQGMEGMEGMRAATAVKAFSNRFFPL